MPKRKNRESCTPKKRQKISCEEVIQSESIPKWNGDIPMNRLLSNEIILEIALYVQPKDFFSMKNVCRDWYILFNQDSLPVRNLFKIYFRSFHEHRIISMLPKMSYDVIMYYLRMRTFKLGWKRNECILLELPTDRYSTILCRRDFSYKDHYWFITKVFEMGNCFFNVYHVSGSLCRLHLQIPAEYSDMVRNDIYTYTDLFVVSRRNGFKSTFLIYNMRTGEQLYSFGEFFDEDIDFDGEYFLINNEYDIGKHEVIVYEMEKGTKIHHFKSDDIESAHFFLEEGETNIKIIYKGFGVEFYKICSDKPHKKLDRLFDPKKTIQQYSFTSIDNYTVLYCRYKLEFVVRDIISGRVVKNFKMDYEETELDCDFVSSNVLGVWDEDINALILMYDIHKDKILYKKKNTDEFEPIPIFIDDEVAIYDAETSFRFYRAGEKKIFKEIFINNRQIYHFVDDAMLITSEWNFADQRKFYVYDFLRTFKVGDVVFARRTKNGKFAPAKILESLYNGRRLHIEFFGNGKRHVITNDVEYVKMYLYCPNTTIEAEKLANQYLVDQKLLN